MFYENLKLICDKKGLKITPLVLECGGASGSIAGWKKGVTPNSDIVVKLAMRLDVSTDYLLGTTDDPTPQRAKKEAPAFSEGAKMIEDTIHSMGIDEITPALISAIAEMAVNNKNLIRARAKELEKNLE